MNLQIFIDPSLDPAADRSARAATVLAPFDPKDVADPDLLRFLAEHFEPEAGELVVLRGTPAEMRPTFARSPVDPSDLTRGLSQLMWSYSAHETAPAWLRQRRDLLAVAAREVLEHRRTRTEPWVASVRRMKGDILRTVDVDLRTMSASSTRELDVPIELIEQSPEQVRQFFAEQDLQKLAQEIRGHARSVRAHVKRDENERFRLLVGVRPFRACQVAGIPTLRCEVHEPPQRLGVAEIPPRDLSDPLSRLEAVVRFTVEFPAWPEFAPASIAESADARRWVVELEHYRHEAAQEALAKAEAALREHEQIEEQLREEADAQMGAAREAARSRVAAFQEWIARHASAMTRERHRRGWLSDGEIARLIACSALEKSRFPILSREEAADAEAEAAGSRVARTDAEMEVILALEADLAAADMSEIEAALVVSVGDALRARAAFSLPAPFHGARVDLLFAVPPLEQLRLAAPKPPKRSLPRKAARKDAPPAAAPRRPAAGGSRKKP